MPKAITIFIDESGTLPDPQNKIIVVDKKGQKIPDTPENFAALSCILLRDCLLFYQGQIKKIIFDKHFHQTADLEKFDYILKTFLRIQSTIEHVDSSVNIKVNSADMIAGSLLWKYTNRDSQFYELIKDRIVSERILNWKGVKKSFIERIKNLTRTGACTHPK